MQWVKMSEQVPPNPKDKDRINIKFRGLPDTLIYLENSWCWFDNGAKGRFLGYPVPPTGSGSYIKVDKKYIPEIEWLSPDTVQGQEECEHECMVKFVCKKCGAPVGDHDVSKYYNDLNSQ